MSTVAISYEEAKTRIGVLPTCGPRPNATNIRALVKTLAERAATIPSTQSSDHGYLGMVVTPGEYALVENNPWRDFPDPGPVRGNIDGNATATQQRDAEAIYRGAKTIFDSQSNVRRAVNDALNAAIPQPFRRSTNTIGVRIFRATDDTREIIQRLQNSYGKPSPSIKEEKGQLWRAPWNPAEPIEILLDTLEECFTFAAIYGPAYTEAQLVDRALTTIQQTGLFSQACIEWASFEREDKTWRNLKSHFVEAYEARLQSGAGTATQHGYHGAANAAEDDDSLGTITESLAQIQMANNANAQMLHDTVAALSAETQELRANLATMQRQLASPQVGSPYQQHIPTPPMGYANATPRAPAPYHPRIPSTVTAGIPPPAHAATFQQQYPQTQYGRGRMGRRNTRRGTRGGRGQRGNTTPFTSQPGYIPPPQGGRGPSQEAGWGSQPNPYKRYNNWNMCFSCGYDIPAWHTSRTCPPNMRGPGHQEGCDRNNADQYATAGHDICRKGKHKVHLPNVVRPGFE